MATNYKCRIPVQLRFNDVDVLGHVNNTVYFSFFDLGKTTYFEAVRGSHIDWARVDLVVCHVEADFLSPIFLKDPIEVCTAITKIGTKSLTMEQSIIDTATGQEKCVCRTIMVGFDAATNTSKEISAEWKEAIRAYEQSSL
jgi:acyl-CoA thioester hydrolase